MANLLSRTNMLEGPMHVLLEEQHGRNHNVGYARSASARPHLVDVPPVEILNFLACSGEIISQHTYVALHIALGDQLLKPLSALLT